MFIWHEYVTVALISYKGGNFTFLTCEVASLVTTTTAYLDPRSTKRLNNGVFVVAVWERHVGNVLVLRFEKNKK